MVHTTTNTNTTPLGQGTTSASTTSLYTTWESDPVGSYYRRSIGIINHVHLL
jgi:hypothetical protein